MRQAQGGFASALSLAAPWALLTVAAVAAAAIVAGAFDPGFSATWLTVLVALGTSGAIGYDILGRVRGRSLSGRPFAELDGPLLWTVGVWALMRLGGPYAGHLTPLGAGLLAWLVTAYPRRASTFAVGGAIALEVGLTMAGRQDAVELLLHGVMYGGAIYGLRQLGRVQSFRDRLAADRARADQEQDDRDRAKDFQLLTSQQQSLQSLPTPRGDRATAGRASLDYLTESFALLLDMLRTAMGLETAVILWLAPDGETLAVRGVSTERANLVPGPYAAGAGLPGTVLREVREVAVAPVHSDFRALPYYASGEGVGGVFAVVVPAPDRVAVGEDSGVGGVLCVDRADPTPWSEAERRILRLAARKIAIDVASGQRLKATDHERSAVSRFCVGLQALNESLGLEQVAQAALAAVRELVPVDLAVLSTVDGDAHQVVRAWGEDAERYGALRFNANEGLVGQATKLGHILPAGGDYRGAQPVFTASDRLVDLRSLLVLPLMKGDERNPEPMGALTVAARDEGVLAGPHRDLLELIAGQVAVKLDLARAHEQIREMATIDGLTGLNNHRTFQQAFDKMLHRAVRRASQLAMLLTDIDHFKRLNDNYGHPFGDEVLRGVSRVLSDAVRQIDLAARYGGEEFALLLEDSDLENAQQVAERIRAEVEALTFQHEKGPVKVTLSLGVAVFPEHGREKAELIQNADTALYRAKESGRNRVVTFG